jgi:hypothetical protein
MRTVMLVNVEEDLISNWRKLPEKDRMKLYREIKGLALVWEYVPGKARARSARRPQRSPGR